MYILFLNRERRGPGPKREPYVKCMSGQDTLSLSDKAFAKIAWPTVINMKRTDHDNNIIVHYCGTHRSHLREGPLSQCKRIIYQW